MTLNNLKNKKHGTNNKKHIHDMKNKTFQLIQAFLEHNALVQVFFSLYLVFGLPDFGSIVIPVK